MRQYRNISDHALYVVALSRIVEPDEVISTSDDLVWPESTWAPVASPPRKAKGDD